jgi:PAS domain S-box-containing protein
MILRRFPDISPEERAQFFEAILETASDLILMVDRNGIIGSCNRAILNLFGYMPYEVVGKPLSELMMPSHRAGYEVLLSGPLTGAEMDSARRLVGRKKNGDAFPISLRMNEFSVRDQSFYSVVIRDIAKILETERELEVRTNELFLANARLERMAACAAFDLEAPLEMIGNLAPSLKGRIGEEMDRMIVEICQATKTLQSLVVDRLAFARFGFDTSEFSGKDER